MRRCDVIVMGAGAAGSSTAWWLARRGLDVALLERFELGHKQGSSHGGTRIFRLAYDDVLYVGLAQRALRRWRELEDDAGEPLLDQVGGVDHGPSVQHVADALDAAGIAYERVSPAEAAARYPGMAFDADVVLQDQTGRCRADATILALARRAADHGAEVRHGLGAVELAVLGDDRVEAHAPGGESWTAPVAVVTVGAWASPVLAPFMTLPSLVVTQEQVVHYTPREPVEEWPSFIHHLPEERYGLLTPGEGVKLGGHHEGPATSGDERPFELDPVRVASSVAYAERWLPGVIPEPHHGVTCLYTTTSNHDFVLDRRGPIVVGSPCSGHGFKFTPVLGEILADLAMGAQQAEPRWRLPAS